MMKPDDYFTTHLKAHELSMNLVSAHERFTWGEGVHEYAFIRAKENIRELAEMFGFDLVPRVSAPRLEAAE